MGERSPLVQDKWDQSVVDPDPAGKCQGRIRGGTGPALAPATWMGEKPKQEVCTGYMS